MALSKETAEAVREIVDGTGCTLKGKVYRVFHDARRRAFEVHIGDRAWYVAESALSSTVSLRMYAAVRETQLAIDQRAADETAGKAYRADVVAKAIVGHDSGYTFSANPWVVSFSRASKEAAEREWTRQVLGEWAPAGNPSAADVRELMRTPLRETRARAEVNAWLVASRRTSLRDAMEGMSNVAACVQSALVTAEAEDLNYQFKQACDRASSLRDGEKERVSERWSHRVREGVKALKPRVVVYCANEDD